MSVKPGRRVGVAVLERQEAQPEAGRGARAADGGGVAQPAPARPVEAPALYGVALLKVALELKRAPAAEPPEAVLARVLARMRIPEADFRAFLAAQGGLLAALAGPPGD